MQSGKVGEKKGGQCCCAGKSVVLLHSKHKSTKVAEYIESGLHFHFSPGWVVKKYDAHRFFQGLSGTGLKGVDFIATDGRRLLLCEAKNYRRRQAWQQENPLDAILGQPEAFAEEMAQKALDTLLGIDAIWRYYQRKWLFRLLSPLLLRLSPNGRDWQFWAHVHRLAREPGKLVFILWLETERPQPSLARHIEKTLRRRLARRAGQVFVADDNDHPLREELSVRLA